MHVLPHADSVFNSYVVADRDAALDESVIADIAMRADNNIFEYMSKRPDASALANRICFDQRFLVNEWCFFQICVNLRLNYGLELGKHTLLEVQLLGGEAGSVWVVRHEHDCLLQLAVQS